MTHPASLSLYTEFHIQSDMNEVKLSQIATEVETMRSIEHPNVLACLGSQHDKEAKVIYVFLEYMPLGSIQTKLQREALNGAAGLPSDTIQRYTSHIIMALQHLHGLSIAHRDIKSANCLIGDRDIIKVADFGSSARSPNMTDHSGLEGHSRVETEMAEEEEAAGGASSEGLGSGMRGMRGTPFFMAPEVIKGSTYGRRSDIWSVGCTVVEMVTGKPPWSELGNHVAAMFRITSDDEPAPSPASLSPAGRDFLSHCFVRQVAKRAKASTLADHDYVRGEISDFLHSTMSVTAMCELAENAPEPRDAPSGDMNGVGEGRFVSNFKKGEDDLKKLKPRSKTVLPSQSGAKLSKKIAKSCSVDAELMSTPL